MKTFVDGLKEVICQNIDRLNPSSAEHMMKRCNVWCDMTKDHHHKSFEEGKSYYKDHVECYDVKSDSPHRFGNYGMYIKPRKPE